MLSAVLAVTDNELQIAGAALVKEWDSISEDGRGTEFSVRWSQSSRRLVAG